jgi:hypothetical protein
MKMLLAVAIFGQFGLRAAADPANPITTIGQLGSTSILATVLWIQLSKAEKRADTAEQRTIAALQETVPVLALATERLSDKVDHPTVTPADVQVAMILEKIDRRLAGN